MATAIFIRRYCFLTFSFPLSLSLFLSHALLCEFTIASAKGQHARTLHALSLMITYQPSLLRRVAHLHSSNFKHTHTHNATAEQLALEDMLSAQSKRLITEKDVPRELRFSLLGEKRDVFVGSTRTLYACLVRRETPFVGLIRTLYACLVRRETSL